jgi:DNA end-binding protein Ku
MGILLRYPYEVRDTSGISMTSGTSRSRRTCSTSRSISSSRNPVISSRRSSKTNYETALAELLAKNQQGLPIGAAKKPVPDIVNLMGALRASLASSGKAAPASKPADQAAWGEESGQEAQGKLTCSVAFASLACRSVAVQSRPDPTGQ